MTQKCMRNRIPANSKPMSLSDYKNNNNEKFMQQSTSAMAIKLYDSTWLKFSLFSCPHWLFKSSRAWIRAFLEYLFTFYWLNIHFFTNTVMKASHFQIHKFSIRKLEAGKKYFFWGRKKIKKKLFSWFLIWKFFKQEFFLVIALITLDRVLCWLLSEICHELCCCEEFLMSFEGEIGLEKRIEVILMVKKII